VIAVMSLDATHQERLLAEAEEKGLSVRALEEAVRATKSPPPKTGRPRKPPIYRTLTRTFASQSAFEGLEMLATADGNTARQLLPTCERGIVYLKTAAEYLMQAAAAAAAPLSRVLVVDPAKAFGLRVREKLRKEGWVVTVARSSADAAQRMDVRTNCAVINVVLADGCGLELSQRLQRERPGLRCIFITDQAKHLLPERLGSLEPLVYKSSGLEELRVALAKMLLPPSPLAE
jgi:CheY-like chemotaxis protein